MAAPKRAKPLIGSPDQLGEYLLKAAREYPVDEDYTLALIENGARLDCATSGRDSTVIWAVHHGARRLVEKLIEKKVSVDTTGSGQSSLLHHACQYGFRDIAELLLQNGAKLDVFDKHGLDPFSYAMLDGDTAFVDMLLEKGADTKKALELLADKSSRIWAVRETGEKMEKIIQNAGPLDARRASVETISESILAAQKSLRPRGRLIPGIKR